MSVYPTQDTEYDLEHIRTIAGRIARADTKGELAAALVRELHRYTLFDLQIIGGRLNSEIERLPSPYREAVRPHFREQIFGRHHQLMDMSRSGALPRLDRVPLKDPDLFQKFWEMVPKGCFAWNDSSERNPYFQNPKNRLFYYLIAAFTMFVLDEPGHPVGMPFPGGFTVEQRGKEFFCLIRDKEKEVFYSICNFCPAQQSEEPVRGRG
jgi:hypothetical protein